MALKVERREGSAERQILIGMIMSKAVLGPISARWVPGMFPSRWANLLAGWAVDHYRRYKVSPGAAVVHHFDSWAATAKDPESVEAIESLLAGLSDQFASLKKHIQPGILIDQAGSLFNRNKIADLIHSLQADLESGAVPDAQSRIEGYRRVEIGLSSGIEVLTEEEAMDSALAEMPMPLVEYPGAAGNFFGPTLGRDRFIAFLGKMKVGKSFFLLDVAFRGVEQGRNVAYFETGDNSQSQVLLRIASRVLNRPVEPGRYQYPVEIEPGHDSKDYPRVEWEWRTAYDRITTDEVMDRMKELAGDSPARFKMSCHPNSSISVAGIEEKIEEWRRDGWCPDVVVIDYADILAPVDPRAETRDGINATWKAMRAMSQRLHCLVVTATQSDTDSFDAHTLSRSNFSEDNRKLAQVNGMVGINQTPKEKENNLYRLNWVCMRELDYSERKCLWLAGCLPAANPTVLSTF